MAGGFFSANKTVDEERKEVDVSLLHYLRSPTAFASTFSGVTDAHSAKPYTELKLNAFPLSMYGVFAISSTLKHQSFLESLSLQHSLDSEGLISICTAIGGNKTIKKIDLSFNVFSEVAVQMLAESMRINNTLEHITLENCGLRKIHVKSLCNVFMSHKFKGINVNTNFFGSRACVPLLTSLLENDTLEHLNVGSIGMGDEGAKVLASVVARCNRLTCLGVAFNDIGDEGVNALAAALGNCPKLSKLRFV